MIPTKNPSPNTSKLKEQAALEKPTKIARKRQEKPTSYKPGNRRNHESFHSLGGQILYKRRKNITLESKEMRSGLDGWFAWKP
jgi:hypothetical protein